MHKVTLGTLNWRMGILSETYTDCLLWATPSHQYYIHIAGTTKFTYTLWPDLLGLLLHPNHTVQLISCLLPSL